MFYLLKTLISIHFVIVHVFHLPFVHLNLEVPDHVGSFFIGALGLRFVSYTIVQVMKLYIIKEEQLHTIHLCESGINDKLGIFFKYAITLNNWERQ